MLNDWSDLLEYLSDSRIVKYEPYEPINRSRIIKIAQTHSHSDDFGAVCLKNKVIGNIYLEEMLSDCWKIGFVFHYDFQSHDYLYEAASLGKVPRFGRVYLFTGYSEKITCKIIFFIKEKA